MTGDEPNIDPGGPLPTHHQTPEEIFTWYANLGMYVQAFEQLVQSVRSACIDLTTPGNWEQPRGRHIILMMIVFNHQSMTLLAMYEILRALVAETFKEDNSALQEEDKNLIITILKESHEEFRAVNQTRNNILHATWMIGTPYHGYDKEKRIIMGKWQVAKGGLSGVNAVKDIKDFHDHISVLNRLSEIISYILVCAKYPEKRKARYLLK